MRSVMQEFSATRDYQHLGRILQPCTQIQRQSFLCKFILSSAFFCILLKAVCSYPWAVTLQLLAQLSRTAGNKSKINYSLLAPGLLDPGMAEVTRAPKGWEVGKGHQDHSRRESWGLKPFWRSGKSKQDTSMLLILSAAQLVFLFVCLFVWRTDC